MTTKQREIILTCCLLVVGLVILAVVAVSPAARHWAAITLMPLWVWLSHREPIKLRIRSPIVLLNYSNAGTAITNLQKAITTAQANIKPSEPAQVDTTEDQAQLESIATSLNNAATEINAISALFIPAAPVPEQE